MARLRDVEYAHKFGFQSRGEIHVTDSGGHPTPKFLHKELTRNHKHPLANIKDIKDFDDPGTGRDAGLCHDIVLAFATLLPTLNEEIRGLHCPEAKARALWMLKESQLFQGGFLHTYKNQYNQLTTSYCMGTKLSKPCS